ncbi:hypothetical protein [Streptomyces sp. E1N211]|uniref:hypothetical protein n=1 Tax=Streptomyces sp. E1N211 TaxID=1851876 RepID=UPI001F4E0937|nr:hypothetical protein [Streptomyces sp. E1N211]
MTERQEQTAPDALLTRIGQVVMLHHAGDREEARRRLLGLWAEIGEDGDPLHRCTLAHYLADTQDDPGDELAWDLRALTAAEEAGGTPAYDGAPAVRGLYPSLQLNLAADYLRLGRPDAARAQPALTLHQRTCGPRADTGPPDGRRPVRLPTTRTRARRARSPCTVPGPTAGSPQTR